MKEILNRIEAKVDKLDENMTTMDKTLVKQEANLAEHMRRTELLEIQHAQIESELEPVKNHVNQIKGVLKLLSFILPIIGSALAAYYKWG